MQNEYIEVYARRYRVTAKFTDAKVANEHMTQHSEEGVIAVREGTIFLAKLSDLGERIHFH